MDKSTGWYVFAAFCVLLLAIAGLVFAVIMHVDAQVSVGLTVIVDVCTLVLVLFIMAVGFTALKMNDAQQALGLVLSTC